MSSESSKGVKWVRVKLGDYAGQVLPVYKEVEAGVYLDIQKPYPYPQPPMATEGYRPFLYVGEFEVGLETQYPFKHHWTELQLFYGHNDPVPRDQFFLPLLHEFRRYGSIYGAYFGCLGRPHEEPDDVSTWGPRDPGDVDWSGFPSLAWASELTPDWDGTGTVAESWTAVHGEYVCRIDRFTEGRGFAYTVTVDGNPIANGENVSAGSFPDAERGVLGLLHPRK